MKVTQEQQVKGQKLYQSLVEKAWEDANFKEQLISSPLETIYEFTDHKLKFKDGVSFVVEDQSNNSTIYLNIPKKIDLSNIELSEEQLELIAGGAEWIRYGKGLGYDIGRWLATI